MLSDAPDGKPQVILLDEPFTAIDKGGVVELQGLLVQHVERGGAVVMTSHQALQVAYSVTRLDLQDLIGGHVVVAAARPVGPVDDDRRRPLRHTEPEVGPRVLR